MSSFFTSSSIFTKFKDAIFKGESDLFNFGAPLGDYGSVLNSKLKQASSVVTKANTLNDVENERGNRQLKRSASFEKEWIELKVVEPDLKAKLNKLYGGTVIKSLSSVAEGDEEAVTSEEQYPFGDAPTDEEAVATCLLALKTLGSGCAPAFKSYLQHALNLNQAKFSEISSKLETSFKLDVQSLILTIDEIKDPVVSYPTAGVYCMAGVVLSKGENATLIELQRHGHVKHFTKSKVHLSADTSWKEQLELYILGRECILQLELWEASKRTPVEGAANVRIALHYSSGKKKKKSKKEKTGSDEDVLLGIATIRVSADKHDATYFKWESFVDHGGKEVRGKVRYSLCRTSTQFKLSLDEALRQHKLLSFSVMNYDSLDSNGRHKRSWDGALTTEGTHLLRLHALRAHLTELQQTTIQVVALVDYLQWYLVDIPSLHKMVEWMMSYVSRDYVDEGIDESDGKQISYLVKLCNDSPESPLLVTLITAFDKLIPYYRDVLTHHLFYFDPRNGADLDRLRDHIQFLKLIYSFQAFTNREGSSVDSLKERAALQVKEGCKKWYQSVYTIAVPQESSEDERLHAYTNVLKHVHDFLQNHVGKFCEVFNTFEGTSVNYSEVMYYTLDELIFNEMEELIRNEAEIGTSYTYHLFHYIRCFCQFNSSVAAEYGASLKCSAYPEWFEPFVRDWIDEITRKARAEIVVLFDNEDLEASIKSHNEEKKEKKECTALVADSAIEVKILYGKLSLYWNQLQWPVAVEHFWFAQQFVKSICQLMTFYANKNEQRMANVKFYSEGVKNIFSCCAVNPEIFMGMNSFDTCLEVLKILPTQFNLNQCVCNLDTEGTEVTQEQAQESLDTVIQVSQEDIEKKLENLFKNIETKLKPDLQGFVKKLLDPSARSSIEEAALPLCNFLSDVINTYRKSLLATTLERFLKFSWNLLCGIIDDYINALSAAKQPLPSSTNDVLQIFGTYFHASGNGLSNTALETPSYMTLRDKVCCKGLSTKELTDVYLLQLADVQANSTGKFGSITINVTYSRTESYLFIAVIACSGLKAVDADNKAELPDPHVEAYLLPPCDSMKKFMIKAESVKKTSDPLFKKQVYEMTIPQETHLDHPGTSVVFLVKNRSKLLGLSVISCKDVRRFGVRGRRSSSQSVERKIDETLNKTLPLINYMCVDSQAFKELHFRASRSQDNMAKQIIKIIRCQAE
ncbi:protein unc-13 homolog D-like isoform X2 [Dysidea avara]|uniref:protein unc-13 homolog D-like isoform X2 n=1 Tax=Dysidea avara TaxID=196820 RepID=UPI00331B2A3A